MIKIFNESLQDVSNYLTSSSLIEEVLLEFPDLVDRPGAVERDVNNFIVNDVSRRFPNDPAPREVEAVVYKIAGQESEVISSGHFVILFNGVLYDYTANQFAEEYSNLITVDRLPVTQSIVSNENQLNDGISSVKSYALLVVS